MSKSIVIKGKLEGADQLIAEMQAVGLSVKGTTRKGVRAGSKVIQAEAERRAAVLSSRKGKSVRIAISSKQRGSVEGKIGPSKKKWYLRFFETGTRAGVRTARKGGFFFRAKDGRRIYIKRIRHPGTAARPWLRPAFDVSTTAAREAFGAAMRQAIETKRAQIDNGPSEE